MVVVGASGGDYMAIDMMVVMTTVDGGGDDSHIQSD